MDEQAIIDLMPAALGAAKKFYRRRARRVDEDDLVGVAYLAIVKAAQRYTPERGPYENFGMTRIKYALRDAHRKADMLPRSLRRCAGHTQSIVGSFDHVPVSREISQEVAAMAGAEFTAKRMKIVALVAQGMSNREIAAEVGCSVQVLKNSLRMIFALAGVKSRMELAMLYLKRPAEEIKQRLNARKIKAQDDRTARRKAVYIARLEAKLAELRREP